MQGAPSVTDIHTRAGSSKQTNARIRLVSGVVFITWAACLLVASGATAQDRAEVNTDRVQTILLEVRLAETAPARGLIEAAVQRSDRKVYLHDLRVITNNDVVAARVVENGGQYGVAITLTGDGAARMTAATSTHIGKPLAIIVEGEVVAAPAVRSRISDQAVISGNFTREQAERIASGLQR
jgi:preprotein translocase subunit SecD